MAHSQPPSGATRHPHRFEDLEPGVFERLVYWLVKRCGEFTAVQWYGGARDRGRDVVAFRHTAAGREKWYIQCKRYRSVDFATLRDELDKLAAHAAETPGFSPHAIVFATACDVPPQAKDRAAAHARQLGLPEPYYWGRLELDERLKAQPETEEEFIRALSTRTGLLPPRPALFVGRDEAMADLRARLAGDGAAQVLTAVRGWPGVGKTTLAQALAHDAEIARALPDGVLWATLGPRPNVMLELYNWGCALGLGAEMDGWPTPEKRAERLRAQLRDARALLIVDDVSEADDGRLFDVGGPNCRTLFTTRYPKVAHALVPRASDHYCLGTLDEAAARELLEELAPAALGARRDALDELIRAADGLPLALKLAGLALAADPGWGLEELLAELRTREGRLALASGEAHAGLPDGVPHSVAAIFALSTDRLAPAARARFAWLGAIAPDPATFDPPAAAALWGVGERGPGHAQDVGGARPAGGARGASAHPRHAGRLCRVAGGG